MQPENYEQIMTKKKTNYEQEWKPKYFIPKTEKMNKL